MQGIIQVSTADVFSEATFRSEKVTEGILWEVVEILEQSQNKKWSRVKLSDSYEGWIYHLQIKTLSKNELQKILSMDSAIVWKTLTRIQSKESLTSIPICEVVIGTKLPVISENGDWLKVLLPFGEGFILSKRLKSKIKASNLNEKVCEIAKSFLGVPYVWGGKSPKGFDCSGLVQKVFNLVEIDLPRDSKDQFSVGKEIPKQGLKAGDLVFFTENNSKKISHVGIALNEKDFIHSSGWVKVNSFDKNKSNFAPDLNDLFAGAKRILESQE